MWTSSVMTADMLKVSRAIAYILKAKKVKWEEGAVEDHDNRLHFISVFVDWR